MKKENIKDLRTQQDVKETRTKILQEQKGLCKITSEPAVKPCLDHKHDSEQLVRGVLSHGVNIFLGTIESAYIRRISWWCKIPLSTLLRRIADYLELKPYEIRHPDWKKKIQTEFNKLKSSEKDRFLNGFNQEPCKNDTERKTRMKDFLAKEKYSFTQIKTALEKSKEGAK